MLTFMRTVTQLFVDRFGEECHYCIGHKVICQKNTGHKVLCLNLTLTTFTGFVATFHGQQGWIIFFPRTESLRFIQKQFVNFSSADSSSQSESLKVRWNKFSIDKIPVWLAGRMLLSHRHQVHQAYASISFVTTWTKILGDERHQKRKASVLNMSEAECFLHPEKWPFQTSQPEFLFLIGVFYFDLLSL